MIEYAAKSKFNEINSIPTGLGIDRITGIGGIPTKRITEIYGRAGLGKTTLCLHLVASAQRQGLRCLWIDTEWSWTNQYAVLMGVDIEKIGLMQNETSDEMLDEIVKEIKAKKWDLVVLDSVGGIRTEDEAEKGVGGVVMGGQAKLVGKLCRATVPYLSINDVALVVINHEIVDIMSGAVKSSGGWKLEYHKGLSIRLKKGNKNVMQGDTKIGEVVLAEVKKNKIAGTKSQIAELVMMYGKGFSKGVDKKKELMDNGQLVKEGQFYLYNGERVARGEAKLLEWLNTTLKEEVAV